MRIMDLDTGTQVDVLFDFEVPADLVILVDFGTLYELVLSIAYC